MGMKRTQRGFRRTVRKGRQREVGQGRSALFGRNISHSDQYWPPWRATSIKPTKLDTEAGSWIAILINSSFGSTDGH